jgi:hypothetical protein
VVRKIERWSRERAQIAARTFSSRKWAPYANELRARIHSHDCEDPGRRATSPPSSHASDTRRLRAASPALTPRRRDHAHQRHSRAHHCGVEARNRFGGRRRCTRPRGRRRAARSAPSGGVPSVPDAHALGPPLDITFRPSFRWRARTRSAAAQGGIAVGLEFTGRTPTSAHQGTSPDVSSFKPIATSFSSRP